MKRFSAIVAIFCASTVFANDPSLYFQKDSFRAEPIVAGSYTRFTFEIKPLLLEKMPNPSINTRFKKTTAPNGWCSLEGTKATCGVAPTHYLVKGEKVPWYVSICPLETNSCQNFDLETIGWTLEVQQGSPAFTSLIDPTNQKPFSVNCEVKGGGQFKHYWFSIGLGKTLGPLYVLDDNNRYNGVVGLSDDPWYKTNGISFGMFGESWLTTAIRMHRPYGEMPTKTFGTWSLVDYPSYTGTMECEWSYKELPSSPPSPTLVNCEAEVEWKFKPIGSKDPYKISNIGPYLTEIKKTLASRGYSYVEKSNGTKPLARIVIETQGEWGAAAQYSCPSPSVYGAKCDGNLSVLNNSTTIFQQSLKKQTCSSFGEEIDVVGRGTCNADEVIQKIPVCPKSL